MRTSLVVVTALSESALDATMMGLSWDLPGAVAVRHRIDAGARLLTRVVSDATGELERVEMTLEHVCVGCALREDVVPTLERLAREGRWRTVVCCLPLACEADQLCSILAEDRGLARHLDLSCVVAALAAPTVVEDLLGDALLRERGLHLDHGDRRGVGEVGCALVERADVVVLDEAPGARARDLVRALCRADAVVVHGAENVGADTVEHRHRAARSLAWCSPFLDGVVPDLHGGSAWRLDLASPRAFHPQRLLDRIELLGTGSHRSRGVFWVPTRPRTALVWDGSGGQLSIGTLEPWGGRRPRTRLLLTGTGAVPAGLRPAFDGLLCDPAEAAHERRGRTDGLEPWLGEIDLAA